MLLQAFLPVIAQTHNRTLRSIHYLHHGRARVRSALTLYGMPVESFDGLQLHRARCVDKRAERTAPEIPGTFFLTLRPEFIHECIQGLLAAGVHEVLEYCLPLLCNPVLVG